MEGKKLVWQLATDKQSCPIHRNFDIFSEKHRTLRGAEYFNFPKVTLFLFFDMRYYILFEKWKTTSDIYEFLYFVCVIDESNPSTAVRLPYLRCGILKCHRNVHHIRSHKSLRKWLCSKYCALVFATEEETVSRLRECARYRLAYEDARSKKPAYKPE